MLVSFAILTLFLNFSFALDTPIIGVLCQETYLVNNLFPKNHYRNYIAASYIKYLESAGARAVPVWTGQDKAYYQRVVNYTNGILIPGGGTYLNSLDEFSRIIKYLYSLAKQLNDDGVFYPMFGICLGMQSLAYSSKGHDVRLACYSKLISLPLIFEEDYQFSRLYKNASTDLIERLQKENLTYNFHRFCLTEKALRQANILDQWKILTTNKDKNGLEFISSMEHVNYPFIGTQFHPEKSRFEYSPNKGLPHGYSADLVSEYFATTYVELSKQNNNTFPNRKLEDNSLIYNFNPIYTGKINGSAYTQLYMFTKEDLNQYQLK